MRIRILLAIFFCLSFHAGAQKVAKLTITDNLSSASRFSYSKPKPAAAKDHFYLLTDKGTQVLFYAELLPGDSLSTKQWVKFTAYKTDGGKDEWVDDRNIELKPGQSYAMVAMNFFTTGTFKVVVTGAKEGENLAEGTFLITK